MGTVTRRVLMIEIDCPNAESGAQRIEALLEDAVVWGEVDGVDAALLVLNANLGAPPVVTML